MYDIYPDIDRWLNHNQPVGLATVTCTWGSSPRPVGAKMAFTLEGEITGSVSGGCIEGAVIEAGVRAIKNKQPEYLRFGVTDETAMAVGLSCGGTIEVFVRHLDPSIYYAARAALHAGQASALVSIIDPPGDATGVDAIITGTEISGPISKKLDNQVINNARQALRDEKSQIFLLEIQDKAPVRIFIDVINPPPTLIIVGGVHIAITLVTLAKALGYRTVVMDPRRSFGSKERFPHVDQLIQAWPDEAFQQLTLTGNTSVAVLTHDPKIDDPALKVLLKSPVLYIGALGSRKTQEKRRQRLLADGLTPDQLDRIHGPIGLDLGSNSPEETALAIMAEIISTRHRRNF